MVERGHIAQMAFEVRGERIGLLHQRNAFKVEKPGGDRLFNLHKQVREGEGLRKVRRNAERYGPGRRFQRRVARYDHELGQVVFLFCKHEHVDARHVDEFQIGYDKVEAELFDEFHGAAA